MPKMYFVENENKDNNSEDNGVLIFKKKKTAKENYDEQKDNLTKSKIEFSKVLQREYQNQGLTSDNVLSARELVNQPFVKPNYNQNNSSTKINPFMPMDNIQKVRTATDNAINNSKELLKDIKDKSNKLSYSKYLMNVEKVGNEKTSFWDKTGGNITRAIKDLVSNFTMDSSDIYIDENGKKVILPSYNDIKQQKVSEDYDTGIGKFLGDAVYNSTKILGSTALDTILPGAGTAIYWQDTGIDSYKNAINQGYDSDKAMAYALVSMGSEYMTGKLLGSATKTLTGGKTSALEGALEKVTSKLVKNPKISSILAKAGSEGIEEFTQEYIDNINRLVTLENSTNIGDYASIFADREILESALYSAGVGAFSGGAIGSVEVATTQNKNNIAFKEFKNQLEEAKTKTTDVSKIEKYDNAIKTIDNHLKNTTSNSIILPTTKSEQQNYTISDQLKKSIQIKTREIAQQQENVEVVPIETVIPYLKSGGYRTQKQVNSLVNSIKEEGITSAIELSLDNDSNVSIANGNHRLDIANKLGLKEVPVRFINSQYDDIVNSDSILYNMSDERKNYAKGEYQSGNRNVEKISENNDRSRNNGENGFNNNTSPSNGRTGTTNVELYNKTQGYNNRPSSTTTHIKNNSKELTGASFLLPVINQQKKLDVKDRLQLPMRDSSSKTTSDIPKNISPISYNDNTTNRSKSQVAPLPSKYNMNQTSKNIPIIKNTENSDSKTKTSLPLAKNNDVLKMTSKKIANQIKDTGGFDLKERSWIKTSIESEALQGKILIEGLDKGKINYVVQSNKKSLDKANNYLDTYGYEESLKHVNELIKNEGLPSASDIALMQRMIQEASKKGDVETVQNLIMDTAILGTDLGQATQALSMIQRLTPEGQLKMYTKLVRRAKARGEKSFQNVEITPEMVQNVLEAYKSDGTYDQNDLNGRVEKFKQEIADQMKSTVGEKIDAWRYLSMLGNPKTHIRNMVSNVAMAGTIKFKNAVARTIETIAPVKTRTKTWKSPSQEVRTFAKQTAIDMKSIITGENRYNEKSAIESKKQIFKNRTLEKISDFNSNALEAEDWFFSKNAFRSAFQEYLTANGIVTENDIKNNPEIIEKAKIYSVEQAEIATFRQYSKLASEINRIERNGKVLKYALKAVLPFKKTPINVAKAGINYSPLGFIKNVSYDVYQLKTGKINASQFIDNLSQGITGTSLTLIGYALAKAGILSGAGDDDKESKYDSQLGSQTYSLNIGGNSYSISWLSPVAMPLLVGSNFYEKLEDEQEWNPDIITNTLAETIDPLSEMSFVSSLTDTLTSYNSGSATMIKDIGETATQSYIMQFFPTLFSQMASTLDDKKRSTKVSNNSTFKLLEETMRKIMYKIPGLRNKLEVSTDIWGNEKEQSSNIITRAIESFITPYSKTKNISTDLDKEIKRVYTETGEASVIPGVPYAYTKYGGETYRMSAKEYTTFKKTYGNIASTTLSNLINSNGYQKATDEEKAKMIDNVYDYARAKANQEYFENVDGVNYESDLLNKINSLNKSYGISANKYFANKSEYDYAYKNPEKYATIKQITSYDKYKKYTNDLKKIRSNAKDKKAETIRYVNSLNLNIPQKAILIKQYYSSFNTYNKEIINYVNNQKLSIKEKQMILEQLGFKVENGRVY